MIPFLNLRASTQDKHRSIGKKLTLSLFFDEHYFPHAQATKRLTHHDWSIFNTHMRASLGKYLLDDLTNPVLDVWVREQVVAGYQRSTINKHIHLDEPYAELGTTLGLCVSAAVPAAEPEEVGTW
jgi:hypothetical protein